MIETPPLTLSSQICFLVHRLDQAIGARYRPLLDQLGLTYPQYLAMLALWEHQELTIGELCQLLGLDSGTVSPLAKRLEAAGWVQRTRNKNDERCVSVTLTPQGMELKNKAVGIPQNIGACLLTQPDEYQTLYSTLKNLLERLRPSESDIPN